MSKINKEKTAKQLLKVNKSFDMIQQKISQSKDGIVTNDIDVFEKNLVEALLDSERQYIQLKRLASENINNKLVLHEAVDKEIDVAKIEISVDKSGTIRLKIPIMTPFSVYKRLQLYPNSCGKERTINIIDKTVSQAFLIQKVLNNFIAEQEIDKSKYENMTVIYNHIFKKDYAFNKICDSDNYAYKTLNDIISAAFCRGKDNFCNVTYVLKSSYGNSTHTEIYIVPEELNLNFGSKIISLPEDKKQAVS